MIHESHNDMFILFNHSQKLQAVHSIHLTTIKNDIL